MDSKEIKNDEKALKTQYNNDVDENFSNTVNIISSDNNNRESEKEDEHHEVKNYREKTIQKIHIKKQRIYMDKYDRYDSDDCVNSTSNSNNSSCFIY